MPKKKAATKLPTDPITQLADLVRNRVWTYLTSSTQPFEIASVAEDLFQLPRGDLKRLAASHLAVLPETREMLDGAARVLRDLPSVVSRSKLELRGAIRPPVSWQNTVVRRCQSGDPSLFVCFPPQRRYDTPLARLVKLALSCCVEICEWTGLKPAKDPRESTTVGDVVTLNASRSMRLLNHSKLRDIPTVKSVPGHWIRGAHRVEGASAIISFLNLYRDSIIEQIPSAVREVVDRQLLIPSRADRLLELFVVFELIDGLSELGYVQLEHRLLPGARLPFARLRSSTGSTLVIWFQRAVSTVISDAKESKYLETLAAAGIRGGPLKPDLILMAYPSANLLLVEVKFSSREDGTPEQVGVKDALTYLYDNETLLRDKAMPRALVVAWSSAAAPSLGDVVVSSHENVKEAMRLIMNEWGTKLAPNLPDSNLTMEQKATFNG